MGWEAWFTLGLIAMMIVALERQWGPTDLVLLATLTLLVTVGAVAERWLGKPVALPSPRDAFAGLGNEAVLTVGVLFVVAAGLTATGAVQMLTRPLLLRATTARSAQFRLLLPIALLSAFMNNTPIVAMFLPVIGDLCKKHRISPSKLFIPLSYATVLGGVITIIGTSTNLLINGLLIDAGYPGLKLFDIAWVGLPVATVGMVYLLFFSRRLLPDRKPAIGPGEDPREYSVEMIVEAGSGLVGQTLEAAGLRHLPGLYVMEIERAGQLLPAVASTERLHANDRLVFIGVIDSIIDLQKIRGLKLATNQVFKLDGARSDRVLIEAVVSNTCPLLRQTIREGRFRSVYNAAVIAVARNGQRLRKKVGDIILQPGDTLLLEAHPAFVSQQRNNRDFFLVSTIPGAKPPRHEKAWLSLVLLVLMVVLASMQWLSMFNAALIAAGLLILGRCCTGGEARRSVDWSVLVSIAAALGIGRAMQISGAAPAMAGGFLSLMGSNPWVSLAAVYGVTILFTEVMSNNAAAAVIFPLAMATAARVAPGHPMAFIAAVMIGASCGFASPLGYQTHLMVAGPGGYRFGDFLRIGLPLDVMCGIVTIALAPLIWPFA